MDKITVTFEVCAKESKAHLFYFDAICSSEDEAFSLLSHYKNWYHYNYVRLVSF
jgi:hypothetical protein